MHRTLRTMGDWLAVLLAFLLIGLIVGCINPNEPYDVAAAAPYTFHRLPECNIYVMVGDDFTQTDLMFSGDLEPIERAFPKQYQAAEYIANVEYEYACDVHWTAVWPVG